MSFSTTWPSATVDDQQTNGDEPPEPGLYTAAIADAKALTSKKGEDWAIITWRGYAGQAINREWPMILGFKSQEQANYTKRVIRDIGVDVDAIGDLDDLDAALKQQIGRFFNIEIKQDGTFRNTYVRGATQGVQSDLPTDDEPAPAPVTDDDDPPPF